MVQSHMFIMVFSGVQLPLLIKNSGNKRLNNVNLSAIQTIYMKRKNNLETK